MAIDRQDCVLRPFRRRLTKSNVKKVIFTIWVVTLCLALVQFVYLTFDKEICQAFEPYRLMVSPSKVPSNFFIFGALLGLINVSTILTIIVSYIRIVKRLRWSVNSHSGNLQKRHEIQLTKMTFRMCAIFILCWFPAVICMMVARIGRLEGIEISTARVVTMSITKFNYLANPIIYRKMLKTSACKTSACKIPPTATANDVAHATVNDIKQTNTDAV